jgi:hypothetical protein
MGWTMAGGLAFIAVVLIFPVALVIRVVVIGFFGFAIVDGLAGVIGRQIAFRVDQAGVTLGGNPLWYRSSTHLIPWEDVEKITVWNRKIPAVIGRWTLFSIGPFSYVGVHRRAGAPAFSRDGTGRADGPAYMAPVPGIAAGAARAASMWTLDHDRLAAAVAAWSPRVAVVDIRK